MLLLFALVSTCMGSFAIHELRDHLDQVHALDANSLNAKFSALDDKFNAKFDALTKLINEKCPGPINIIPGTHITTPAAPTRLDAKHTLSKVNVPKFSQAWESVAALDPQFQEKLKKANASLTQLIAQPTEKRQIPLKQLKQIIKDGQGLGPETSPISPFIPVPEPILPKMTEEQIEKALRFLELEKIAAMGLGLGPELPTISVKKILKDQGPGPAQVSWSPSQIAAMGLGVGPALSQQSYKTRVAK